MRSAVSILVALQLVSVKPPAARATVVLGLDASASVALREFSTYPEIVRTVVLPLLRRGDELVLVRIDSCRRSSRLPVNHGGDACVSFSPSSRWRRSCAPVPSSGRSLPARPGQTRNWLRARRSRRSTSTAR